MPSSTSKPREAAPLDGATRATISTSSGANAAHSTSIGLGLGFRVSRILRGSTGSPSVSTDGERCVLSLTVRTAEGSDGFATVPNRATHSVYTSPAKHLGAMRPWPTIPRWDSDGARARVTKAARAATHPDAAAPPIVPFPRLRAALTNPAAPPIHAPERYPPRTMAPCEASETHAVKCVKRTRTTPMNAGAANLRATRVANGLDIVERSVREYRLNLRALAANVDKNPPPPTPRGFDDLTGDAPSRRPLRLRRRTAALLLPSALAATHAANVTLTKHTSAPTTTGSACHNPDRETYGPSPNRSSAGDATEATDIFTPPTAAVPSLSNVTAGSRRGAFAYRPSSSAFVSSPAATAARRTMPSGGRSVSATTVSERPSILSSSSPSAP
mmetsp:Transcript_13511/g.60706  ORF Transcript_13511/g.60706 Transcript_13511/m.60706 type:complete len:387 (-) Transcript_13511:1817-2977(-)